MRKPYSPNKRMNNLFHLIQDWMQKNNMTLDEKRTMRTSLVSYMSSHPVKSKLLSPYSLRYFAMALSALVLVLGGSVGVSFASQSALPNQTLYPVKIWIEEYKSSQAKTPEQKIAIETTRVQTRFAEASQLAIKHQLNADNSAVIQAGIEHSELAINSSAESVSFSNPELALAATNNVEAELASNGKILAAIGKNTNQNLQTFILGTQVTTQKLTLAKTNYEQIVATTPNNDSKTAATTLLAKVQSEIALAPVSQNSDSSAVSTLSASSTDQPAPQTASPAMMTLKVAAVVTPTTSTQATAPSVSDLVATAKTQMTNGSYSDALVTLQKAQQQLDEMSLTQSLEKTYQVTTDSSSVPSSAVDTQSTTETTATDQTQTPADTTSSTTDATSSPDAPTPSTDTTSTPTVTPTQPNLPSVKTQTTLQTKTRIQKTTSAQ